MQTKSKQFQSTGKTFVIEIILIIPLCLAAVLLYASLNRPIWIDEFLHFAFASFDTTALAWNAITHSLSNTNHGQTGIYILVNYWSLKFGGAEVLALRAPSLICAFFLCYFSALTLKIRGYGFAWQALAIFIMFCQSELMYFAGEARPYMPLATASVGTLVYYLATPAQRSLAAIRLVGWSSVSLGVLIHPYFSIYWFAIAAFGLWVSWFNDELRFAPSSIAKYLNLPLCIVGSSVYLVIASQTWLTGSPLFDRDPFRFMPQSEFFYLFVWNHTTFLGPTRGGEKFLILSIFFLFIFYLLPKKIKVNIKSIIPPIVLIYLALSLSVLLSMLSYYQNYWILTRQWVGSIALVAIGFTWLCAELLVYLTKKLSNKNLRIFHFIVFFSLLIFLWNINSPKTKTLWAELTIYLNTEAIRQKKWTPEQITCPITPDTWVELANKNLAERTAVWPIFKFYYSSEINPYCLKY